MFLALTGETRLWNDQGDITFLGEWCRRHEVASKWKERNHRVLPYHWDDRERLQQDFEYLKCLSVDWLPILADALNGIHGTSYSDRYWKILVGPWLLTFLSSMFDRYACLLNAESISGHIESWTWEHPQALRTPASTVDYFRWLGSDLYNDYIFGLILRHRKRIQFTIQGLAPDELPQYCPSEVSPLERLTQRARQSLVKLLPPSLRQFRFFSNYLGSLQLWELQFALRQFPGRAQISASIPKGLCQLPLRADLQAYFTSDSAKTDFEVFVLSSISRFLPSVFLESYQEFKALALREQGQVAPKAILMTGTNYFDEGVKFFAAESMRQGTKLIGSQHGGCYGLSQFSVYEDIEVDVSDNYLTWGWLDGTRGSKVIAGSSPYLTKFGRGLKPKAKGQILWVQNSMPRYTYALYSAPLGPQFASYLKDQERFASKLDPEIFALITLRLYEHGHWDEVNRWGACLPGIRTSVGGAMKKELKSSRLCICTTNTTTFLETLASNFPTLAFWNSKHWEIRLEAQPEVLELQSARILHFSPESAADLVNAIGADPLDWWFSKPVQSARLNFCQKFARTTGNWLSDWLSVID